jgi:Caspase domain
MFVGLPSEMTSLPSARLLDSAEVKACFGRMHVPLAALLNRDPGLRGSCHDVVMAFEEMVSWVDTNSFPSCNIPHDASRTVTGRYLRTALVIGNGAYQCEFYDRLPCPVHDALRMQQELQARGFTVTLDLDLSARGIERCLEEFVAAFQRRQHIKGAPPEVSSSSSCLLLHYQALLAFLV